ncbi:sister chromatid cohesion protein PDS5 homolog A-like [Haemaphysalis longicornis]
MNFPPYVQPFDATSAPDFLEAQLRVCVTQCGRLTLPGGSGEAGQPWVNDLALLLSGKGFLGHSSGAVQLMVARCHSLIMLSTVDGVPYSGPDLVNVLEHLIMQLGSLKNFSGVLHAEWWELFKTLGHGRLFIRLQPKPRNFPKIIRSLFVSLYSSISHDINLIAEGWRFLSPILNDLDAPEATLGYIFAHLIPPLKKKFPFCYAASKELVRHASYPLQQIIEELLDRSLATHDLAVEHNIGLLHEVVQLCPMATQLVFGRLARMVQSASSHGRFLAVQCLGYLMSRHSLHLAPGCKLLCKLYLERFDDSCAKIQQESLAYTTSFLLCDKFSRDVFAALVRLMQTVPDNVSVRLYVIELVTRASVRDTGIVTDELIKLLQENTRCNSAQLRHKAIFCLGELYSAIVMDQNCARQQVWKVASTVLAAYQRRNASDQLVVKQVYADHLVPMSLSGAYRMELLYGLYCNIGSSALNTFWTLHKNLPQAQSQLKSALQQATQPDSSETERARDSLTQKLRKDKALSVQLLHAINNQQSAYIAYARNSVLHRLENTKSRLHVSEERLLWDATFTSLSADELDYLVAYVAELKPPSSPAYTPRDVELFQILAEVFPASCEQNERVLELTGQQASSEAESEIH